VKGPAPGRNVTEKNSRVGWAGNPGPKKNERPLKKGIQKTVKGRLVMIQREKGLRDARCQKVKRTLRLKEELKSGVT